MKAKTITLSIALAVVLSTLLSAQQTVHFEYDGAGNRILRYITVKKLTEADTLLFEPALPLHALLDKPTEDLAGEAHIHVYPNPTYGLLNVEATGQQQGPLAWYLFDQQGKLLQQGELPQASATISLETQPPGTYFLFLPTTNDRARFKIIKH